MKRYFFFLATFICTFTISCKDYKIEGIAEDRVGFVNDGAQMISPYNAQSEFIFESAVYKSGVGNRQTIVKIDVDNEVLNSYNESHNTSLEILPKDCYIIENGEFQLNDDNVNTIVRVKIDVKKLSSIQGTQVQKYALPLKLRSSGGVEVYEQRSGLLLIPEIIGGIRPNSAVTLFRKTFEQMGINQTDHNTGSFAISTKYLFVNTRSQDLKYYDRFSGEYIGSIPLAFKGNLTNFTVTNDDNDNLLITNLRNAATGLAVQTIYRIKGTSLPEKYIEYSHTYPNGRKLSITGDLDKDAIITSTVENSSKVLYWSVKNGVLLSQEPQVYTADSEKALWVNMADAIALDVNLDKGLFIAGSGSKSILGYFNKDGQGLAQYDLIGGGLNPASFVTQSLSYAEFNGVEYLAVGSQQDVVAMFTTLLNVTNPKDLQLDPNSQKLMVYKSDPISTNNNGNKTADVHLKVSDDKETMALYSLGTNGSIVATQFDSKTLE